MSKDLEEKFIIDEMAEEIMEDIIKQYRKYNVNIDLKRYMYKNQRYIFSVKMKGNTRETHIRAYASDIQVRLKYPLFIVHKQGLILFIIVSKDEIKSPDLSAVLSHAQKTLSNCKLPYIVGYNVEGELICIDIANQPHLLLGGATNSGKSVGLRALITSIIHSKQPYQVSFVMIDVGALDLMVFDGVPHLVCPVVHDCDTAYQVLEAIKKEMERRINLKKTNENEFRDLPRLVLVIDEFPALFTGTDNKNISKQMVNIISSLLQRGRHAKIHLVLAAQNPTFQNMKVDLGNVTTRIAFKCAKRNFSETILGEGGAENLSGKGDMLLKSSEYNELQRIQGSYIAGQDIKKYVQFLQYCSFVSEDNKFEIVLSDVFHAENPNCSSNLPPVTKINHFSEDDKLLAKMILEALKKEYLSANMLMREYGIGWNRVTKLVTKLEELGIIEKLKGKLSRHVIPKSLEDLPDEMVRFIQDCGYTIEVPSSAPSIKADPSLSTISSSNENCNHEGEEAAKRPRIKIPKSLIPPEYSLKYRRRKNHNSIK